ncbi:MAG: Ger(x)C family spore germination C-terminal domain-containing protein, partial [Alicyclobacillus sp.]|nr:Ger(x)C family spore germination C-terminal domain-containing protein [Alicyclobacillus sp.]
LCWLLGPVHELDLEVPCPEPSSRAPGHSQKRTPGGASTLHLLSTRTRITPYIGEDGQPRFRVLVRGQAEVERLCQGQTLRQPLLEGLAQEAEEVMRAQILQALKPLQAEGLDAVQFGTRLYRRYPAWWKRHRTEWRASFQKVPVNVEVQLSIVRSGLITHSVDAWMKNSDHPPLARTHQEG